MKDIEQLPNCPHCGGPAVLKLEGKHYTTRYRKKVQYGRIICKNNNPFKHCRGEHRCLAKTVAAPIDEVIKHWSMRIK